MPVPSQNDGFRAFGVTPDNQEIPDLTAWIVFCSKLAATRFQPQSMMQ